MRATVTGVSAYLTGFLLAFYVLLVACGGRGPRCEPPRLQDSGGRSTSPTCEVRR